MGRMPVVPAGDNRQKTTDKGRGDGETEIEATGVSPVALENMVLANSGLTWL